MRQLDGLYREDYRRRPPGAKGVVMTGWTRSPTARVCGGCAMPIDVGDPVLVIVVAGLKRGLVRGACCAGPAPPDLPHLVRTIQPLPVSWQRFDGAKVLPFTREREPGEEG